jgi:hypothetical protein
MRWVAGLMLVLAAGGCRIEENPRGPAAAERDPPVASFVNRAWVAADAGAAPGSMRVFLEDGTLLMTSCAEVYRLARWEVMQDGRLSWSEDGARIDANVVRQNADSLVLELELGTGRREQHFASSTAPFACPALR